MEKSLIVIFDKILDKESKRIANRITDIYKEKIKVNKSFRELVNMLVKKELRNYTSEIEARTFLYLPNTLTIDDSGTYALITRESDAERHLLNYISWCRKNSEKNHKKVAKQIADELIHNVNNSTKKGLAELVSSYVLKYFPNHCECLDSRAVILLLQKELKKKGYEVKTLLPLKLKKVI